MDKTKKKPLLSRITEYDPSKKILTVIYILFLLCSGAVSFFHEPWLDEAQAWMIARDASYYDMIFVIPHYEGHPALWTLILSLPAKLGMPYELSLGIIMLVISAITAYLILFRSPFKGLAKVMLPFTYFFFYQYGIIARPYGLLTLAFLLAAITYKNRNSKPFLYVLSLILLCGSSAFGIIISGGLAIAWCIQLLREYGLKGIFTEFIKTQRFAALAVLLASALFMVVTIASTEETFTNDFSGLTPAAFIRGLWYMLVMVPADAFVFGTKYGLATLVKYSKFSAEEYIIMSMVGLLILAVLMDMVIRRRKILEFVIPYSLTAVFGAGVYFICHHVGVIAVYFVFVVWICMADEETADNPSPYLDRITASVRMISAKSCTAGCSAVCLVMGFLWSLSAAVIDINNDYYYGRAVSEFIKENGLDELNIMSSWYYELDQYGYEIISADKQHYAVTINPYFDENIFFNFNSGDKDMGYILHRLSPEANEEQYALWRNTVPDILVGEPMMGLAYENTDVRKTDYILIKTFEFNNLWKLNHASHYMCVYMHKDLFDDYPNIHPENPEDYEFIS